MERDQNNRQNTLFVTQRYCQWVRYSKVPLHMYIIIMRGCDKFVITFIQNKPRSVVELAEHEETQENHLKDKNVERQDYKEPEDTALPMDRPEDQKVSTLILKFPF